MVTATNVELLNTMDFPHRLEAINQLDPDERNASAPSSKVPSYATLRKLAAS